jgi:metal-responsive CopG/Arc/MetJ family transcriptional regulator
MKTTINLEDELYRKLVNEALKKYGNTRSLSKVVNENIASHLKEKESMSKDKERKEASVAKETFGIWKTKETGVEYVKKLRDESEKRLKKMGL